MDLVVIAAANEAVLAHELTKHLSELPSSYERLDLNTDEPRLLSDLLSTQSLFSPRRCAFVRNLQGAPSGIDIVETYALGSNAQVLATYVGKLSTNQRARLSALGTLIVLKAPTTAAERQSYIKSLFDGEGVALSRDDLNYLSAALAADVGRATSIATQLAIAGATSPSSAQLRVLVGSARPEIAPWNVTDALAAFDAKSALLAATQLEPVVLSSWVCAEVIRLCAVKEQALDATTAATTLALAPFRAQKLVRFAQSLTLAQLHQALRLCAELELTAKSDDASTKVLHVLAQLTEALARTSQR